jgi:hypothetical protein
MDVYHIWCNLRTGVSDAQFSANVDAYLGALAQQGLIEGHRITRRKLGLGPATLGEFHVSIEIRDLAQLDRAFQTVSTRSGEIEGLHAAVNQMARDLCFALYRDFPDPQRVTGEERF